MPQPGGDIHIGIAVVDQVKAPEEFIFMHDQVHQPAAEIEGEHADYNRYQGTGMEPVYESELLLQAPVGYFNNDQGQPGMQNQVHYGKEKIYASVPDFIFFIVQGHHRDGPFEDPEEKHSPHEDRQPFQWSLFQVLEIVKQVGPHGKRFPEKIRRKMVFFPWPGLSVRVICRSTGSG